MQEVPRENVTPGKLYYIECLTEDLNNNKIKNQTLSNMVGIFKSIKIIYPEIIAPWNAAVFDWFEISQMKHIKDESDVSKHIIREVELNYLWRFYEVKKFKIQRDMEQRALNLCLQKITGDPYFQVEYLK
jgi:hypothetical protein